ncbi:hypothetical protein KPH14_005910 [Odynerus spinipes]|uniref:Uncharacterized protein n=1 Tax=Odynerus spinipes TaxID=1348599 RepID=A0AAD9RJL3_9HYME|nr:hypothetical protein KPH14_005910 [Odynerus spinipes]
MYDEISCPLVSVSSSAVQGRKQSQDNTVTVSFQPSDRSDVLPDLPIVGVTMDKQTHCYSCLVCKQRR